MVSATGGVGEGMVYSCICDLVKRSYTIDMSAYISLPVLGASHLMIPLSTCAGNTPRMQRMKGEIL